MERPLLKQPQKKLTLYARICFGAGHFLNDLCSSMWFTYLLVYFHLVINFSSEMAGYLILIGQTVDAVLTPVIGIQIDRSKKGILGGDKRKCWHFFGTLCVVVSFTFLFNLCIGCSICDNNSKSIALSSNCIFQFVYYVPFVMIFQIGWAITQISHLSLIPVLTNHAGERLELVSIRNGFQVVAGIVVYSVAWILLNMHTKTMDSQQLNCTLCINGQANYSFYTNQTNYTSLTNVSDIPDCRFCFDEISSADLPVFTKLVLIIVGIGTAFQILFYCGTPVKNISEVVPGGINKNMQTYDEASHSKDDTCNIMTWVDWLKELKFYLIGILYMSSRMVVNLSQTYLSLYLAQDLHLPKSYIAIIPLIIFTSGFLMSLVQRPLNHCFGTKVKYFIGCIMVLLSCVWMWFLQIDDKYDEIFYIAVLLGLGNATLLIYSLTMVSNLIGTNSGSGAFVFGVMSFFDKISNGVAIAVIQNLHPNKSDYVWSLNSDGFYRKIMVFVPGCLTVVSLLTLLLIQKSTIGDLNNISICSGLKEPEHHCHKICKTTKCNICLIFTSKVEVEQTSAIRYNSSYPDFQKLSNRTKGSM